MPAIIPNRLKGNYGAALVSSRLSGECLVRPVAADTDVGIDLYCETVAEGHPFLHFWLQVKAGDQCNVDPSCRSARWGCPTLAFLARVGNKTISIQSGLRQVFVTGSAICLCPTFRKKRERWGTPDSVTLATSNL